MRVSVPLLFAFAACRRPDTAAPSPSVPPPVSATITADGGELEVPGPGGSLLVLTVPPDALVLPFAPLTLTVTPEAPQAGERFRVSVSPGEAVFTAPVSVRIELPSPTLGADAAMYAGPGIVPASIGGRVVETELLAWSSAPVPSPLARGEAEEESMELWLEERTDTLVRVDEARALLARAEGSGDLADAAALQQALRDLAAVPGVPEVGAFLDEAAERACRAHQRASDAAARAEVDDYDQVRALSHPVIGWAGVRETLGTDGCPVPEPSEVLIPIADSAAGFHATEGEAVAAETEAWDQLVGEIDETATLSAEAGWMGVEGVAELMVGTVADPLIEELRPAAWDACAEGGDPSAIGELLVRRPEHDALRIDLHSCGTRMGFDSRALDGRTLVSGTVAGVRPPATPVLTVPVDAKVDGTIAVTGSVRALTCPGGAVDQEQLVVTFDDHTIDRLDPNHGEYLLGAPSFAVHDLLVAAGIDPADASEHRLTFTREGTGCNGAYGDGQEHVATLVLNVRPDGDLFGTYFGTIAYAFGHDSVQDGASTWTAGRLEVLPDAVNWYDGQTLLGSAFPYDTLTATSFTLDNLLEWQEYEDPAVPGSSPAVLRPHSSHTTVTGTVVFASDGTATVTFHESTILNRWLDSETPQQSWFTTDMVGTKPAAR